VKKGKSKTLILAILLVALGVGCRYTTSVVTADKAPTRLATDDLGRQVTLPVTINRAVSLAPSLTESIFAVRAGDRLVGVTTYCDYPEQAKAIAKVGDTMNPNIETIVALKPDVVFVSTASQIEAFAKTLADNGIGVYVTDPTSIDGVLRNLQQLGELFGTKADGIVNDLNTRVGNVAGKTRDAKKVRVFVQISKEPLFTIGNGSFLNAILERAGGESVTKTVETAYPKISKETALALDPEAIVLSDSEDNREPNEVFRNSPAVKNGRVYRINADLLSRPGPRLVDALEQIARYLHPEKFAEE
jgi:iron complex transport system substrate-binding protein